VKCSTAEIDWREEIDGGCDSKERKNWIGHSLRHDCLFREIMEGEIAGKSQEGG